MENRRKSTGLYTLGEIRKSTDKKVIENYQNSLKSICSKFGFKIIRLFI